MFPACICRCMVVCIETCTRPAKYTMGAKQPGREREEKRKKQKGRKRKKGNRDSDETSTRSKTRKARRSVRWVLPGTRPGRPIRQEGCGPERRERLTATQGWQVPDAAGAMLLAVSGTVADNRGRGRRHRSRTSPTRTISSVFCSR